MDQSNHASLAHRHQENNRIANRSALSERAAQGNFSQFNSLDLLLPWFGTRRTVVVAFGFRPRHGSDSNSKPCIISVEEWQSG